MDGWTVDELAERAADALAAGGVRAPNGRVTALPDRRVIRWYATIGLLDPPLRARGRTARYGERHLLQLVAVKRRQAQGRSLTDIQTELAGATDATLRRVADLDPAPVPDPAAAPSPADRPRFWAASLPDPAPAPESGPVPAPEPVYPVALHPAVSLVLPAPPTADDLAALHSAAQPLLDLLAARGLLTRPSPRRPR